ADLGGKAHRAFGYFTNTYRSRTSCTNNFVLWFYSFYCFCLFSTALTKESYMHGDGSDNNCLLGRYKMAKDKSGEFNYHLS
ncbi:unnamed protein product, partial [marine sediment metagenome]